MTQYEIITYDEFKQRRDGGFYLLYWSESGRYYGGRAVDYSRRKHRERFGKRPTYLSSQWNKRGPPDSVIVAPLKEYHCAFEQAWLDLFSRFGPLYDKRCMNMSGSADSHYDGLTQEQLREYGRRGGIKAAVTNKRNGTGCFYGNTRTLEQCRKTYAKTLGKLTPEQRSEGARKAYATRKRNGNPPVGGGGFCMRKLISSQIHDIRHLLALGDMLKREIAECFQVSRRTIRSIEVGETYADV